MTNQPIEEKWKRELDLHAIASDEGTVVPIYVAVEFIENLLEQERRRMSEEIYQARKSNTTDSAGDVWEKVRSIINK